MRFLMLSFVLLWTAAAPASAQQAPKTRFARWIYEDAAALVAGGTASDASAIAVRGVLLLVPMTQLDRPVDVVVRKIHGGSPADFVRLTETMGSPYAALPSAVAFGAALALDDERLQDAAFTSLESFLYASAAAYGVKHVVGRLRPENSRSPYRFRPLSGHTSFPSGHVTTVFALLTPWALYYPHPATYAAVVLVGGTVGYGRIAAERHWLTDVAGGAVLGAATAAYLVFRHTSSEADAADVGVFFEIMPAPEGIRTTLRLTW